MVQHESDGLHRLAQAHVIGQATTCAPFGETGHPLEALPLVVAQLGLQLGRDGDLHLCRFVNLLHQLGHALVGCHATLGVVDNLG